MKKTVKNVLLISMVLVLAGCAAQQNQAVNNQRPSREQGGRQGAPPNFAQLLAEMDTNKDGKLAKSEVKGPLSNDFSKIDTNDDGFISESELKNAPRPQRSSRN